MTLSLKHGCCWRLVVKTKKELKVKCGARRCEKLQFGKERSEHIYSHGGVGADAEAIMFRRLVQLQERGQCGQDPSHQRLQGVKMQTFFKGVGKVSEQTTLQQGFRFVPGPPKDMFPQVQLCRFSKATVAVLKGSNCNAIGNQTVSSICAAFVGMRLQKVDEARQ